MCILNLIRSLHYSFASGVAGGLTSITGSCILSIRYHSTMAAVKMHGRLALLAVFLKTLPAKCLTPGIKSTVAESEKEAANKPLHAEPRAERVLKSMSFTAAR